MSFFKTVYKVTVFALPLSAGSIVNMLSSFVAMLFVAQVGKLPLAAGALGVSTFITIMTVFTTIFYALSILIGHYRGRQKSYEEIGHLVKNGFWLALLMAVPAVLILWHIDKVLLLFKQDPLLVKETHRYFHYAALSMIPMLFGTVILQFHTGISRPRFTLIISSITLPFNILLSYCLILGKWGFPQLSLAGVTASAFIVQLMILICLAFYLFFSSTIKKYKIFSNGFWPNISVCNHIFILGLPIGIQFGTEIAAMTVATYFMGYFGVSALAAVQIVSQYSLLVVMLILGLSQAVSVLISEAFGDQNLQQMREYLLAAIFVLSAFFIVVFTFFLSIPKTLMRPYIDIHQVSNHYLVHLATIFFALAAILLLTDGIRNLLSGALRGLHDSKAPMKIGVICLWVISLPISYLCGFLLKGGPVGLRAGFISGFIVAVALLWRRFGRTTQSILSSGSQR